jgi:L-asparagine transporter-like permease
MRPSTTVNLVGLILLAMGLVFNRLSAELYAPYATNPNAVSSSAFVTAVMGAIFFIVGAVILLMGLFRWTRETLRGSPYERKPRDDDHFTGD